MLHRRGTAAAKHRSLKLLFERRTTHIAVLVDRCDNSVGHKCDMLMIVIWQYCPRKYVSPVLTSLPQTSSEIQTPNWQVVDVHLIPVVIADSIKERLVAVIIECNAAILRTRTISCAYHKKQQKL